MRVALTLTQSWHRVPGGTGVAGLQLAAALGGRDDVDVVGVAPWARRPVTQGFEPSVPMVHLGAPAPVLYDMWHYSPLGAPEGSIDELDLVHATTVMVPPTRSTPLVVTVHDLYPVTHPEVLTKRGARLMRRGLTAARDRAAVVCCPSHHTALRCAEWGFDADRLRVVPWAVTADDASGAVSKVAKNYRLDRPYLLWVGTVEPRKNLDGLLAAYRAAALADIDVVLVGPTGWGDVEVEPTDGVKMLGFVPAEDREALYAGALALCLPSWEEGFGLPALEAMNQSTPVVGSAGTAVAEIVADTGLLIDPADTDAWVDGLRIAADPSWKADRGPDARRRASSYSLTRLGSRTVAAYLDALDR